MKKVIIIGGGFGGLATAALLGKQGHAVTLIEKNDQLGGRAMVYKEKGFTFDMGPSWYLMPDVFEHYFALFNKKPTDLFQLKRLDPQYRIFFSPKEFVDIRADVEKNLQLFESMESGAAEKIREYLRLSKYKYELAMKYFLYKNYNSIFDFFNLRMMIEGPKMHLFENFAAYVSRFVKNEKIKSILQYSVVFLGGAPKKTPAMYSVISHADFNLGVFYPMGGMASLVQALVELGKAHGVTYVTGESVQKINVTNGVVSTVTTDKNQYSADVVISNADYPFTETQLLEPEWQTYKPEYWEKQTVAPSAFIMYLGIKGKIEKLQHHTLTFDNDWERHFDDTFNNPSWPEKPSYYICAPSKTDSTVAPEGCENVFILVPVAPGLEDTPEQRKKYEEKILTHFENIIGESIRNRIMVKKIHSINDYKSLYNAYKGTALGLAHTLMQTAIFRPSNKSKKVKNLYFAGHYTIPGVGVPMCFISAELVVERMKKDGLI